MEEGLHYYSLKEPYLVDFDMAVGTLGVFLVDDLYHGELQLYYDFWVEDTGRMKKNVYLEIRYECFGSRERAPFFIYDVFVHEIALTEKDRKNKYRWEHEVCATSEMLPLVRKTVKRQLKDAGLDNHFSCRIDFMHAYIQKLQDEENSFLSLKEMSCFSAAGYLTEVCSHEVTGRTREDYTNMLEGSKRVLICEVSSEGKADEIANRMKYAVDSLEVESKKIIYYIEAGSPFKAGILNPDVSVLTNTMARKYKATEFLWGYNPDVAARYTRAIVCVTVK